MKRLFSFFVLLSCSMFCEQHYYYLSEDVWYETADWILDSSHSVLPENISAGDTIVIRNENESIHDTLSYFQNNLLPRIQCPILLITPRSDYSFPDRFEAILENEYVAYWLTQNIDRSETQKLKCIPIGFSGKLFIPQQSIVYQIASKNKYAEKKWLAYLNISINTNAPERLDCYTYFSNKPWAHIQRRRRAFTGFLVDLKQSKFVISPPGNGLDCHRTWETLFMGAYPIVKRSTLDPLFEGLPVLLVNDWSEVNEALLEETFERFQNTPFNMEKAYATYWLDYVRMLKKQVINSWRQDEKN